MGSVKVTWDKNPARFYKFTRMTFQRVSYDPSEDSVTSNGDSHQYPDSNQPSRVRLRSPPEHYPRQKDVNKLPVSVQHAHSTKYHLLIATPRFCNIIRI